MTLIVDASVAVKWVLPEPGSDEAAALRKLDLDLLAPSLIIVEIGNALWKSALRGDLEQSDALAALRTAVAHFARLVPFEELAQEALPLAINLRQPVYDCFYLALAQRDNAALVTADERMFAAARKAKIKVKRL